MAYSANPGNDSEYTDAAPAPAQTEQPDHDESKEEQETALLPESILMGKKFDVGEEVVFKIVGKHDGQIEVAYSTEEPGEKEPSETGEEAMTKSGDDMGSMMY